MPQLKCDEWPDDEEPTTTEQEVPITAADIRAIAEFQLHMTHVAPAESGGSPLT